MDSAQTPAKTVFSRAWLLFLPPLLACAVHLPVLWSELIWDDESLIIEHPRLAEPGFYREVFARDYGLEFTPRTPSGYYRPALMLFNVVLYQAFGKSAAAYHAAVLVFFSCAAFLLTWLLWKTLRDDCRWLAIAIGCLAAVHPIRTEYAVFFMSLPDVLLEIAVLLSMAVAISTPRVLASWLASLVLALLAFAAAISKETSFVVFGAIGVSLLFCAILMRRDWPPWLLGPAIFAGLACGLGLRRWAGVAAPSAMDNLTALFDGSGRALQGVGLALRDFILPSHTVFMRWQDAPSTPLTSAGVAVLLIAAAASVIWLLRRDDLLPALSIAWLGGGLVGLMMIRSANLPYADRYAPSGALLLGLGLLAAPAWRTIAAKSPRVQRFVLILVAGGLAVSSAFAWVSTLRCANALVFFGSMAEDEPNLAYPRLVLANLWFFRYGDFQKMEQNIREAVAISPDVPAVRASGKLLAKRLIVEQRYAQGLRALDWAGEALPDDAEIWSLRATCLAGLREYPKALAAVDRARQLQPNHEPYQRQRDRLAAEAADRQSGP